MEETGPGIGECAGEGEVGERDVGGGEEGNAGGCEERTWQPKEGAGRVRTCDMLGLQT